MRADLLDSRLTVGFQLPRAHGAHFCFKLVERVADNAFAACNGNVAPARNSKHAPAHGAEARSAIGSPQRTTEGSSAVSRSA